MLKGLWRRVTGGDKVQLKGEDETARISRSDFERRMRELQAKKKQRVVAPSVPHDLANPHSALYLLSNLNSTNDPE
jgi:hypothetical protein